MALLSLAILFSLAVLGSFGYGFFLLARSRELWTASRDPTLPTPDVEALLLRAREHLEKREVEQALVAYRRILAAAPMLDAQLGLAEAEFLAGRDREAVEEYERALRLDASNVTALERLGRLYSQRRETWGRAEERYRDYLNARPGDAEAELALARLLAWRGRGKEALALYSRGELQPLLTRQDRRDYALALVEVGRGGEAEPWLEKILDVSPSDDDVRLALAGIYASRREWQRAIPLYRALITKRPEDASLNLVLGQGLLSLDDYRAAVIHLEKAARELPSNRDAALAHARALRGTGRLKQADQEFERAMVLGENAAAVAREYADLLTDRKRYQRAELYYRKALDLGLRDERLLAALAAALDESGKPREALAYLEEAYELARDDRIGLQLARLYKKVGQNDRALQLLDELERSRRSH